MAQREHYSDNELEFIQQALDGRDDLDLDADGMDEGITPVVRQRRPPQGGAPKPAYRSLTHWMVAFFVLPFILTGTFFVFLLSAENFLGGKATLDWLAGRGFGGEVAKSASEAGYSWLPTFLTIYNYRFPIMVACFVICLTIVGILMFKDNQRQNRAEAIEAAEANDQEEDSNG